MTHGLFCDHQMIIKPSATDTIKSLWKQKPEAFQVYFWMIAVLTVCGGHLVDCFICLAWHIKVT